MKENTLEKGTAEAIILDTLAKQDNLTIYEIADKNGFIRADQLNSTILRLRKQQKILKTGTKPIFSKEKQKRITGCYTYSLLKKPEESKQKPPIHRKPVSDCSNQESLTTEQLIKMGKGIASYISSLEQQNIELRTKLHELEIN